VRKNKIKEPALKPAIKKVVRVEANALKGEEAEHVRVRYNDDGDVTALKWKLGSSDFDAIYNIAHRKDGTWNKDAGGWTFKDPTVAGWMLAEIQKKHPRWPVLGGRGNAFKSLAGVEVSRIGVGDGLEACIVPVPLPGLVEIGAVQHRFLVCADGEEVGLLIGTTIEIDALITSFIAQGANCGDALLGKWRFTSAPTDLTVEVSGWAVRATCDLSNIPHYLIAPPAKYRWVGRFPHGVLTPVPWEGTFDVTRKTWSVLKASIAAAGLRWKGDDPEAPLAIAADIDTLSVPGWESPAPNGHLLHEYQKTGVEFWLSRGMRGLIGDEMGVGKTAQGIAAAAATNATRILVVCKPIARYVWDREICEWGGKGEVQHITTKRDELNVAARWHIITYDLLVSRTETWHLHNKDEERALLRVFPQLKGEVTAETRARKGRKIILREPLEGTPAFAGPGRLDAWANMMRRLRGGPLAEILEAGEMLVIVDEAHHVKNRDAKRTKPIQQLAASKAQLMLLTGTPLRNNQHEAAALLGLLDEGAAKALGEARGYTIDDVKDYLGYFMIRRTKADVLPELPDKVRQRIDLADINPEHLESYRRALKFAWDSYHSARQIGESEASARQKMLGGLERARVALGLAKVDGGQVAELIQNVVEEKGCAVVFCAHRDVSDRLLLQLKGPGMRAAVVDGRLPQKGRAQTVEDFQQGRLNVFIGGINAVGEAITLTRADTVIFVELDWVPAALLQAEDRIHRVGQRRNCQIIQLVARMQEFNLDVEMVQLIGAKLARIGTVLNEDTTNIIAGDVQSDVQRRFLSSWHTTRAASA
jgi:superfamily II DNA or RNA helicase